ncbi:hypothetical protein DPMN_020195 [Dreissena polymorpha]|uniref:Uncharacterized protein n=1 Tax=Dreissena polymorpha TaxID=45954 RepID=A0A9D4S7Z8_DREPO|nr:hypothetical protein DPMN_020195 [Dreissena polymorpha]
MFANCGGSKNENRYNLSNQQKCVFNLWLLSGPESCYLSWQIEGQWAVSPGESVGLITGMIYRPRDQADPRLA